jgi:hypothetical protein
MKRLGSKRWQEPDFGQRLNFILRTGFQDVKA